MYKNLKRGLDILSLEAKDIYISNIYTNSTGKGYNPRYTKGEKVGELVEKKFVNKLDFSLELIELNKIYKRVIRRNDFYKTIGKHNYTLSVVNVKFTYNVKEFNKARRNTHVRLGYSLNDIELVDHVAFDGSKLIAIEVDSEVECPVSEEYLDGYFTYRNGVYVEKNNKDIMSTGALRDWLYKNGFFCDGIKFVRYKRSGGASRVGKCLFIDERLRPAIKKWELCGLKIRLGESIDLASFEAYISLPLSSIIDTLIIDPKSILVVDDYESTFNDNVMYVDLHDGKLRVEEKETSITNSIWDGQSLIDKSVMGKYSDKGMILLRNRFFKTCAFNCNIQDWFRDNGITSLEQLNGFTLAERLEDVKIITTPSSIKYLKFGTLEQWLNAIDDIFGVVKHEKKTHFFDGKKVRTHYQLMNTLQMSNQEVKKFLQPSIDYMNLLKTDHTVFRHFIKFNVYDSREPEQILRNSDIVYKMMGTNDKFYKTKVYKDFRDETIKSYKDKMKRGKVFVNGNYSTLLGNPIEMLQQSIGKFNGESYMGVGNVSSKNFAYDQYILGCRSPHIAPSNILLANNKQYPHIDKYVNMTNEIVAINSINENILQRLNGSDFDSDTILLTDDEILIGAAKRNYSRFKVPTSGVPSIKTKRHYTDDDKCDLDIKTGNNKIGEIVNLAQEILSIMWDHINNHKYDEFAKECFVDVCKLAILSGIEIDSAKKEFEVNTTDELKAMKSKYYPTKDSKTKPIFFKPILANKGFDTKNQTFKKYDTTMDYLSNVLNGVRLASETKETIPFSEVLTGEKIRYSLRRESIFEEVRQNITDMKNELAMLWLSTYSSEERDSMERMIKEKYAKQILSMDITESDCKYILEKFDDKGSFRDFYLYAFNYLFIVHESVFFKVIESSKENLEILEQSSVGNIEILGLKFAKNCKKRPFFTNNSKT